MFFLLFLFSSAKTLLNYYDIFPIVFHLYDAPRLSRFWVNIFLPAWGHGYYCHSLFLNYFSAYNVYFHCKSTLMFFFVSGGPYGDFGSMLSCRPEVRLFLSKFVPITCLYTAIRLSVFMHVSRLKPLYINLYFFRARH